MRATIAPLPIAFFLLSSAAFADDSSPLKVFILAGQSNMVGWGDSAKLPDELQQGSDRVLMFESGKWQPLRPSKKAQKHHARFGITEYTFGPEIFFAHEMAKVWPEESIGIVKFAVGGSSILTWKPNWSKEDANRVGQGRLGSLYKKLMSKVQQASKAREIEIVGFLWIQGGGDMKNVNVAKEYSENLKSLFTSVRADTGVADLPILCGSVRRTDDPDDLSNVQTQRIAGPYPAILWVVKAQWEIQKTLPRTRTVILRDIETHPQNVHYNTVGQRELGKLFAEAYQRLQ